MLFQNLALRPLFPFLWNSSNPLCGVLITKNQTLHKMKFTTWKRKKWEDKRIFSSFVVVINNESEHLHFARAHWQLTALVIINYIYARN